MMRRIATACLGALALAGCTTGEPTPTLKDRMDPRMGLTEREIVQELGVPDAELTTGAETPDVTDDVRSLRWSNRRVVAWDEPWGPWPPYQPGGLGTRSTRYGGPGMYGGWGWPGPYYRTRVAEYACDLEIDFTRTAADAPWRASAWRARGNAC
ncbi:hypothetical protein P2H44_09005 [Albimonas sp. CAU 1670]|uniref:hypothetical protein n=1 Tax=Albimonas sp. CAU 1670 TaxID=3032599 RepID=UPI0023DC36C5|nr:hypothetical protein [Albimonas sp. CAU 1670]MDF2232689.1 hypothetical protein [Albimonas sp. CAU 1670]